MNKLVKYCLLWYSFGICIKEIEVSCQAIVPSAKPPYSKTHKLVGDVLYIACEKCWKPIKNCSDILCKKGCNKFYKLTTISYNVGITLTKQKPPAIDKLIEEKRVTVIKVENVSYKMFYLGIVVGSCGNLILLYIAYRMQEFLRNRGSTSEAKKPFTVI